jgi:hypothetical protein
MILSILAATAKEVSDVKLAATVAFVVIGAIVLYFRGVLGLVATGAIAAGLTALFVSNVDEPERWANIAAPVHSLLFLSALIGLVIAMKLCPKVR